MKKEKELLSEKISEKGSLDYLKDKIKKCYKDIFEFKTLPTLIVDVEQKINYEDNILERIEKVKIINTIVWPTRVIKPTVIQLTGLGDPGYNESIITEETNTKDNQLFEDIQKYKHGDIIENMDQVGDRGEGLYQIVSDRNGTKLISDFGWIPDEYGTVLPIGNIPGYSLIDGRVRSDQVPILVKDFLERIHITKPYQLTIEDSAHYGLKYFLKGEKWPPYWDDREDKLYRLLNIFSLKNPILDKYYKTIEEELYDNPEEFAINDKTVEKEIDKTIKELFSVLKKYYSHCYIYLNTNDEDFITAINKVYTTVYELEDKSGSSAYTGGHSPLKVIEITINKKLIDELKSVEKQEKETKSVKKKFKVPEEIDISSYLRLGTSEEKQFPYFK